MALGNRKLTGTNKPRNVETINVTESGGGTRIVLGGTTDVYSKSFWIGDAADMGIGVSWGCAAVASCSVTVILEQGYQPPPVEGSAHQTFCTVSTVMVSGVNILTNWHFADLTFVPMPYGRILFRCGPANTNSAVTVKVFKQVEG